MTVQQMCREMPRGSELSEWQALFNVRHREKQEVENLVALVASAERNLKR